MSMFRSIVAMLLFIFHFTEAIAQNIDNFAGHYEGVFSFTAENNELIPYVDKVSCHVRKNETVGCTSKRVGGHIEGQAIAGPSGLRLVFAPEQMNRIINKELVKFEKGSGASAHFTSPVEFVVPDNSNRFDGIQATTTIQLAKEIVIKGQVLPQSWYNTPTLIMALVVFPIKL